MTRKFTPGEMVTEIEKLVWSKQTWLETFSNGPKRRPLHEIETRELELAVLRQAEADYRTAANRRTG